MIKEKKTVYFEDPLNDEFSGTNIKRVPLGDDYEYVPKNIFARMLGWLLYWIFAYPLVFLYLKIVFHVRVYGKKNRRFLRGQGVFVYGNHTQFIDGLTGQAFALRHKRGYVVCNQDTTSIKGIRWLVRLLGAIPVPENPKEAEKYKQCIVTRIRQKRGVIIFPEAHIWPYSTHIRPFKDDAFTYPAELGAPVVAMAMTYRKRKIFKNRPPYVTLHISQPIYPDMHLSLSERKKQLRNRVYDYLLDKVTDEENYEYIRYVKKKTSD